MLLVRRRVHRGGAHSLRHTGGRTAVEIIEIVLGVGLVGVGVRQWQRRKLPRVPKKGFVTNVTGHLKELNPVEATAVGVLEQPWTLTAAAAVILVPPSS